MLITYVINCNRPNCSSAFRGRRTEARKHGWTCDSPRGLDYCSEPACQAVAPQYKQRGICGFCGKRKSLRKNGCPTQHLMLDAVSGVKVRCPGSYSPARTDG